MKKFILEVLPYVITIIVVILIRIFIIDPAVVSGDSMKPNLQDGNYLLVRKIGYNAKSVKRFDIIVLNTTFKENNEIKDEDIIKRVIGLPGEHISYRNNKLYVNDKLIETDITFRDTKDFNLEEICQCSTIPEGKFLVLGDNRPISKDSRMIGLISENDIVGKAVFRIWPISQIGSV